MASCLDSSQIPSFIEKIPYLLECHRGQYLGTKEVEEFAEKLIDNDFHLTKSVEFVKKVCNWAGKTGNRVRGQVIPKNTPEQIAYALCEGYTSASKGCVAEGVGCISSLHGLRQSFASKMLRFLLPSRAVILDKEIRDRCGYKENTLGYKEFLKSCHDLLNQAQESQKLSVDFKKSLRVCDIESALFMCIRK